MRAGPVRIWAFADRWKRASFPLSDEQAVLDMASGLLRARKLRWDGMNSNLGSGHAEESDGKRVLVHIIAEYVDGRSPYTTPVKRYPLGKGLIRCVSMLARTEMRTSIASPVRLGFNCAEGDTRPLVINNSYRALASGRWGGKGVAARARRRASQGFNRPRPRSCGHPKALPSPLSLLFHAPPTVCEKNNARVCWPTSRSLLSLLPLVTSHPQRSFPPRTHSPPASFPAGVAHTHTL